MPKNLTLQTTLLLIISAIGLLSLGLVYLTDLEYRKKAFKHQEKTLYDLLVKEEYYTTQDAIKQHLELGLKLQEDIQFKKNFTGAGMNTLTAFLDQAFDRFYPFAQDIKLKKIIIYSKELESIAKSSRGLAMSKNDNGPCYNMIHHMKEQKYTDRTRTHSEYCLYDGLPHLSTVIPVGTLKNKGYIQIVSNPSHLLAKIGKELDIELLLSTPGEKIIHQSSNWNNENTRFVKNIFTSHEIRNHNGATVAILTASKDVTDLVAEFDATKQRTVIIIVFIIICTIFLTWIFVKKSIAPLKIIREATKDIIENDFNPVNQDGSAEITSSIRSFSSLLKEFKSLKTRLEDQIHQHQENESKLKNETRAANEKKQISEKQKEFLDITLKSISDGIIITNIKGEIKTINPMAEKLSGWSMTDSTDLTLDDVLDIKHIESGEKLYSDFNDMIARADFNEPVKATLSYKKGTVKTPIEYTISQIHDNNHITGYVIVIHDTSPQASINRHLAFHSSHDALTGLMNKNEFEQNLKSAINQVRNTDKTHALLYIDLSQTKIISQIYGHAASNELVKELTGIIKAQSKNGWIIARYGSGDFCILILDGTRTQAEESAYDIIQAINEFNFEWNKKEYSLETNIGIVLINQDYEDTQSVMDNATSACQRAIELGKNTLHIFDKGKDKLLTQQREMHWVSRVNQAIEENRMHLYFQKIMPLNDDNKILSCGEVLLRMEDKQHDMILPDNFLPAANRYNTITAIDE